MSTAITLPWVCPDFFCFDDAWYGWAQGKVNGGEELRSYAEG